MALTAEEKNAKMRAKYGLAPEPPKQSQMPITQKALEENKKSLFTANEDSPPPAPAPIPTPKPIPPKPVPVNTNPPPVIKRRGRPKKEEEVTVNENSFVEFLRRVFDPNRKYKVTIYYVARFKSQDEAKRFVEYFKDGEYILDGFSHTVRIPQEIGDEKNFIQKAKGFGATECYKYTHK